MKPELLEVTWHGAKWREVPMEPEEAQVEESLDAFPDTPRAIEDDSLDDEIIKAKIAKDARRMSLAQRQVMVIRELRSGPSTIKRLSEKLGWTFNNTKNAVFKLRLAKSVRSIKIHHEGRLFFPAAHERVAYELRGSARVWVGRGRPSVPVEELE